MPSEVDGNPPVYAFDNNTPLSMDRISATWIIVDGKTRYFESSNLTPLHSSYLFRTGAIGSYLDVYFYLSSTHPSRDPNGIGSGMVLLQPLEMTHEIRSNGQFYIHLRDMYNNDCTQSHSTLTFSFSPTITSIEPPELFTSGQPFFQCPFTTQNSGEFALSVYSNSFPIGINGKLIVNSGPAHFSTSEQISINTGNVVGNEMIFTVLLRDINGNKVMSQNANKVGIYRIEWVKTSIADDPNIPIESQTVTFSLDSNDIWPFWSDSERVYKIRYKPEFAGTYYVRVYINPTSTAKETPAGLLAYEMTSSKGQIVAIVAGPAHQHSIVTESIDINSDNVISQITDDYSYEGQYYPYNFPLDRYVAGTLIYYTIQSKDQYGNDRFIDLDGVKSFRIHLYDGEGSQLSPTEFKEWIATDILTEFYTNQSNNYVSFRSEGSGKYSSRLVFKKVGNIRVGVDFIHTYTDEFGNPVTETNRVAASIQPQPGASNTKTSDETTAEFASRHYFADWSTTITPGVLSTKSELIFYCWDSTNNVKVLCSSPDGTVLGSAAATPNDVEDGSISFLFNPRDRYGNQITDVSIDNINPPTTNGSGPTHGLVLQFETSSNRYLFGQDFMVKKPTQPIPGYENAFIGSLSSTISGLYSYQFRIAQDASSPVIVVPNRLIVLPVLTEMSQVVATWPSIVGTNTQVTIPLIDYDRFENPRAVTNDMGTVDMDAIPSTSFVIVYQSETSGDNTNCYRSDPTADTSSSCSQDGDRPNYSCQLTVHENHQSSYANVYIAKIGDGCADIINTSSPVQNQGLYVATCPIESCRTSHRVRVEESRNSNAFVRSIRIGKASTNPLIDATSTLIDQPFIQGDEANNIPDTPAGLRIPASGISFGNSQNPITAGEDVFFFVSDGISTSTPFAYTPGTPRFLSINPDGVASRIQSRQAPGVACDTTTPLDDNETYTSLSTQLSLTKAEVIQLLTGVCEGSLHNTMLYVFKMSFTTLLTPSTSQFHLKVTDKSLLHGYNGMYSLSIRPAAMSPQHSQLTRFSTPPQAIVGDNWTIKFYPIDRYGNPIAIAEHFIGLPLSDSPAGTNPPTKTNTLQNAVIIDNSSGVSTNMVCVYAPFTTVPSGLPNTGIVTCTVSGTMYTTIGLKQYKIYAATTLPQGTSVNTLPAIQNGVGTVQMKPTMIDLTKSSFSLVPIGFNWSLQLSPTVNTPFKIYLSAFDRFGNPTVFDARVDAAQSAAEIQRVGDAIVPKLELGTETQFNTIPTLTPYNGSTWTLETSSSSFKIYSITYVIDQPTRKGYPFSVTTTEFNSYPPTSTPKPLLYAYSSNPYEINDSLATPLPSSTPTDEENAKYYTGLYTSIDSNSPISSEDISNLTVESQFDYYLRVYDQSFGPILRILGTDSISQRDGDVNAISYRITGPRAFSLDVLPVHLPQTNTAMYGVFHIKSSSPDPFSFVGQYTLQFLISLRAGGAVNVATYTFNINPGLPWLPNTVVNIPQYTTNEANTLHFTLYDRLSNVIKTPQFTLPTTFPLQSFTPELGKLSITIHNGAPECGDVHHQHAFNALTYAVPPINSIPTTSFAINNIEFDTNTGEYALTLKISPRNTYSLNMTMISQTSINHPMLYFSPGNDASNDYPGSVLKCDKLRGMGIRVVSGTAIGPKSSYTITPDVPIGTVGVTYTVDLHLRDIDGTPTDYTAEALLFSHPDSNQMFPLSDLFYSPNNPNNNVIDLKMTDLTQVYGRGHIRFTFIPIRVRDFWNFKLYIKHADGSWNRVTGGDSRQVWAITHGAPASVVVSDLPPTSTLAGTDSPITLSALDKWGNPVTTDAMHRFAVTIVRESSTMTSPLFQIDSLQWTVGLDELINHGNGTTTVPFDPSWEGKYSISVALRTPSGSFISESIIPSEDLSIKHTSCVGEYLTNNAQLPSNNATVPRYRCATDQQCVISYSQCQNPIDQVPVPMGSAIIDVWDEVAEKNVPTIVSLTMPVSEGGLGYIQCSSGNYVLNAQECRPVTPCGAGMVQCTSDRTQCRMNALSCPTTPTAPPGFMICPNGINIVKKLSHCPIIPQIAYDSCSNGVVCPDGSCRASAFECASRPTCPQPGWVLCLSDQSCKPSASQCMSLPEHQVMTVDKCKDRLKTPNATLCWNGQCSSDIANCPSSITCPVGFTLCAYDLTCKRDSSLCFIPKDQQPFTNDQGQVINPEIPITPVSNSFTCSFSEVRCSDGTCAQNQALCASLKTCSPSNPILCPDRRCVSSLGLCAPPSTVPTGSFTCPSSGSIVSSVEQCPKTKTCADKTKPILSESGVCISKISDSTPLPKCPAATPYICPFTNVCRRTTSECPSPLSCSLHLPFICEDGSCSLSKDLCRKPTSNNDNNTTPPTPSPPTDPDLITPSLLTCPKALYQCPTGECTATAMTCPSYVTCPIGSSRCLNGSCSTDCSKILTSGNNCHDLGLITCPNPSTGIAVCARKISECPQGTTCPRNSPIKCFDGSCAPNLSDCPALPSGSQPIDKIPCFDGSWSFICSTPVTCPPQFPIKCADQSCQVSLSDCPTFPPCDQESKNKYRCSTGLCTDSPYNCSPPVDLNVCPLTTPLKCPSYLGEAKCVSDLQLCPSVLTYKAVQEEERGWNVDENGVPKPITFKKDYFESTCAAGLTFCRDGSCTISGAICPNLTPPAAFPYLCSDGGFAIDITRCNNPATGCPYDRPIRCAGVGNCVDRLSSCPKPKCKEEDFQMSCPDGTCVSVDSAIWPRTLQAKALIQAQVCVKSANGCLRDEFRCYDGSCTKYKSDCTSSHNVNYINSCPPGAPHRCSNGLCVERASYCPKTMPCSDPKNPILCADGLCRQSTELCPLIKPCQKDQHRCDDGLCRNKDEPCMLYNSCPKGHVRCKQSDFPYTKILDGICALPGECLAMNGCHIKSNGQSATRCPNNGLCTETPEMCESIILPPTNGCPVDKIHRCWDGECRSTLDECTIANGCTTANPFRCPNGDCKPLSSDCPTDSINNEPLQCLKTTCADGSCVDNVSDCKTKYGCPVSAPVRCANGQCRKYESFYKNPKYGLTTKQIIEDTCPLTITCPNESYSLCVDGSCTQNVKQCPGTTIKDCPTGEFKCWFDNTCRPSPNHCGKSMVLDEVTGLPVTDDITGEIVWETTKWDPSKPETMIITSCPPVAPVTCPNGACVSDVSQCDLNHDVTKNILIGSSSSSQKPDVEFFVVCFDGTYRASHAECIEFAKKLEQERCEQHPDCTVDNDDDDDDNTPGSNTDPDRCIDFCPDGRCLKRGQAADKLCPIVQTCPALTYRCWDGSCRKSCPDKQQGAPRPTCEPIINKDGTKIQQYPCIDGVCRPVQQCPRFDGCSAEPNEHFHCISRNCAPHPDLCEARSLRKADEYAVQMLRDSQWYENSPKKAGILPDFDEIDDFYGDLFNINHAQVNKTGVVSSIDDFGTASRDFAVTQFPSKPDIPDEYIPDWPGKDEEEAQKGPGLQEDPTTKGLSCKYNCLSDEKLSSTAIRYNPLQSQQQYLVGPVTSQFTIELFSGVQTVENNDAHVYVEPVSFNLVYNATNRITYSRMSEFGSTFTTVQSILSPMFSCSAGNGLVEPFNVPFKLSTYMDRSINPLPDTKDICLARLRRFPQFNYAHWECIFSDQDRKKGGNFSIRPTDVVIGTSSGTETTITQSSQPLRQAVSYISHCYDPDLSTIDINNRYTSTRSSIMNGLQDNTGDEEEQGDYVPAVYAFIHSPLASGQFIPTKDPNWFQDHVVIVLIIAVVIALILFSFTWACCRLSRYKKKIENVKEQRQQVEEAILDLEYGTPDDQEKWQDQDREISVSRNPLAYSPQDYAVDDETVEARERKIEHQRRKSVHNQSVIAQMEADNDAAMEQLQILRRRSISKLEDGDAEKVDNLQLEVDRGKQVRRRSIAGIAAVSPNPSIELSSSPAPNVVMPGQTAAPSVVMPGQKSAPNVIMPGQKNNPPPPALASQDSVPPPPLASQSTVPPPPMFDQQATLPPPPLDSQASVPPPPPTFNLQATIPPPPPTFNLQATLPPEPVENDFSKPNTSSTLPIISEDQPPALSSLDSLPPPAGGYGPKQPATGPNLPNISEDGPYQAQSNNKKASFFDLNNVPTVDDENTITGSFSPPPQAPKRIGASPPPPGARGNPPKPRTQTKAPQLLEQDSMAPSKPLQRQNLNTVSSPTGYNSHDNNGLLSPVDENKFSSSTAPKKHAGLESPKAPKAPQPKPIHQQPLPSWASMESLPPVPPSQKK